MSRMSELHQTITEMFADGYSIDNIVKILKIPHEWVYQCLEIV